MSIIRSRFVLLLVLVIASSCLCTQNSTTSGKKLKVLAVFPHSGYSHFIIFKSLVNELARRGHDVTIVSYFPRTEKEKAEEPLPTLKDIDLRDDKSHLLIHALDVNAVFYGDVRWQMFTSLRVIYEMAGEHCTRFFNNQKVKQLFDRRQQFDVFITEAFNSYCANVFLYDMNAPLVLISSHQVTPWAYYDLGLPQEASYMPSILTGLPRPMNFFTRVWNLITILIANLLVRMFFLPRDTAIVEKYGVGPLDLSEINGNASLLLANTHYVIHGSVLHPHNVIEVGGIHIPKAVKPLPKNIKKFLDEAQEGVLYFNLGSLLSTASVPKDKQELFLRVFSSLPRKVLWKWDVELENITSNIMIQKWLPQYDVLNHPNVKCFFGHAGLLGITESVKSGVPMIVLPIFGDQFANARAIQDRGMAEVLDFVDLTEEKIRHTIDELFNNTKYTERVKALQKVFFDRPMSPLDEAVWWVEYVARGNGPYLRSLVTKQTWYQYHYVDVWAFLITVALLFVYLLYMLIKCVFCRKRRSGGEKERKSKKKD
ncbi:UDP-glucosyltransferase 2 [Xylocopa sonorina]|uniref:UDP-glucosyltransferase 2 n=1 Tax=Xylocopa sonorina TaxID=1818115 RepID=UPI00403AE74C